MRVRLFVSGVRTRRVRALVRVAGFAAAVLATLPGASSLAQWNMDGQEEEHPWMKRVGEGGYWLIVTPEPKALVELWGDPQRSGPPVVRETSRIKRNHEFGFGVLFSNCSPAKASGKCHLTAQYQVFAPDGRKAYESSCSVWDGKPGAKNAITLSDCVMPTHGEDSDPVGTYLLKAIVTDHVTGRKTELQRPFELLP